MGLEELKNVMIDEDGAIVEDDSGLYRNHSKEIAIIVGFMLGVSEEHLAGLGAPEDKYEEIMATLKKNNDAVAIRALNNIRSNIMLQFKKVSNTIRVTSNDYSPIYNIDIFKDDFKTLDRLEVKIITGRQDLIEYLTIINTKITSKLDGTKKLFPDWVDFKHIRAAFTMQMANVKGEQEKFQANQTVYPFKRFFNWKKPHDCGNILLTDERLLKVLYESNGSMFYDEGKVSDVSDHVKESISEFINAGEKVQIFIDGENVDPYKFASAIESLQNHEVEKIDKIVVYYDNMFNNDAWAMLKHFTLGIEVEPVGVDRIKEDKSLVDHKLVAGVSKAVYREDVDSVIIVSSDSDFWSVIEDVDANYLVMIEEEKCGYDYKDVLRRHEVFYCYLDRFKTSENNKYFKAVFRKTLDFYLNRYFTLGNANEIFKEALGSTYGEVSQAESESMFNKYIKGLKLGIDDNGEFELVIPE